MNTNDKDNNRERIIIEPRTYKIIPLSRPSASPFTSNVNDYQIIDSDTVCNEFIRFRIFEEILSKKRNELKLLEKSNFKSSQQTPLHSTLPQSSALGLKRFLYCPDNHVKSVADLVQRWNRMRLREDNHKLNNKKKTLMLKDSLEMLQISSNYSDFSNAKFFGKFKMNLERIPLVPTLLRIAKCNDVHELQKIIKQILIDGISSEKLNAADLNGRTALSYLCTTANSQLVDILLKLPETDYNKSDIEGNSPLHYAAQTGKIDIIKILLLNCNKIEINRRNCWGMTPIMKAVATGNMKCAEFLFNIARK